MTGNGIVEFDRLSAMASIEGVEVAELLQFRRRMAMDMASFTLQSVLQDVPPEDELEISARAARLAVQTAIAVEDELYRARFVEGKEDPDAPR